MLVWLDLETTGLQADCHEILEIAVMIAEFERPFVVAHAYHAVLHFPMSNVHQLEPVVRDMHTRSGLLEECHSSRLTIQDAEEALTKILPSEVDPEKRSILAGSTVGFDKGFLDRHLPSISERLSYRLYDISAVKLFCRSLGMPKLEKGGAHRAREDIRESIEHGWQCASWLRSLWRSPSRPFTLAPTLAQSNRGSDTDDWRKSR